MGQTPAMTPDLATQLAAVEAGGRAVADLATGHLDVPVPACPEWDVAGLLTHLGGVYSFVTAQLRARADAMVPAEGPDAPEGPAVVDWFRESHQQVLDALRAADPSDAVWTFAGAPNAGFYQRRMMHETTVHRFDAESAVGDPAPIDPDIAFDGLEELFEVMYPRWIRRTEDKPRGSLHLHRTDGEGEWMLDAPGGELTVTRTHAKGDAAVRGPVAQLLLLQWERIPPDHESVEVFGDADVVASWTALSA